MHPTPTGEYVMKSFHINKTDLKAAAINLVRNLPITIEYMAAAALVPPYFFLQQQCNKYIHHIHPGHHRDCPCYQLLRRRHPGFSFRRILGEFCLYIPLPDFKFHHVRLSHHLPGHGPHIQPVQQHLHHDYQAGMSSFGKKTACCLMRKRKP